jgi:thiamine-phosphate pyrophosphorylase
MKALYVTDRATIGDDALARILDRLGPARGLSVQIREKNGADREVIALTQNAREKLGEAVPLFVNRRFDVALAAGATGVHLPSNGLPLGRVRTATPRGFRIGVSTHSAPEARAAIAEGADLVVIGPIFETPSKRPFGPALGPEELGRLPASSQHESEVYAIGGIDEDRLKLLEGYRDRIAGIAAVRLFQEAADPAEVLRRVVAL